MAKKSSKKQKTEKPAKVAKPRVAKPKPQDLPGMEDRALKPLEEVASAYAQIRDQRIELNREEHSLKEHAIKLMRKYGKTIYHRNGITIRLVEGEDDIKIKIRKAGDEDETAAAMSELEDAPDGDEASGDDESGEGLGETADVDGEDAGLD